MDNQSSFTQLIFYMFFIHLKWGSSCSFPKLLVPILFFQIQQGPGPNFRKVGKFLHSGLTLYMLGNDFLLSVDFISKSTFFKR